MSVTDNVTVMPGGYAATVYVQSPDRNDFKGIIWTSPDAMAWTEHEIDMSPSNFVWTPTYGVAVLGVVPEAISSLSALSHFPEYEVRGGFRTDRLCHWSPLGRCRGHRFDVTVIDRSPHRS